MESFFGWVGQQNKEIERPWLVLGKGPSFDKYKEYDLNNYNLMSLNHVVERLKVTAAHIFDLEVVFSCEDSIYKNANVLVMPWVPHFKNKPSIKDLSELSKIHPFLRRMSQEGRLLYYNHMAGRRTGNDPLIEVSYFSSEAAIDLLAKAGVSRIRTLGIDGGKVYSNDFSHLVGVTLLSNGRKTFNKQFEMLAKTIIKTGVDLAPLDIQSPIRVYVAAAKEQMLAMKVLEYSIRKYASMTVEVYPMCLSSFNIPRPKDEKNWPRTPFSFQRFLIPSLTGYKGKAVYLDSDMQVFKDIKNLWNLPFNGAQVLAVAEPRSTGRMSKFSVMLLDCDSLNWDVRDIVDEMDAGKLSYENLMLEMSVAKNIRADIDSSWNCLERYDADETALLHYTDMNTQPWVSVNNPLGYLWFRTLLEAIDNGFITSKYIKEQVDLGYVRPSLLYQLEHRVEDSLLLPKSIKRLDDGYSKDFMVRHGCWASKMVYMKSLLRYTLKRTGMTSRYKKLKTYFDRE